MVYQQPRKEPTMIGPAAIFTLFFVTLGPLKILGPFAQRTHKINDGVEIQRIDFSYREDREEKRDETFI
jgi:hypothetical protein